MLFWGDYELQATQRVAIGRVEELCAESGLAKWLMLTDNMDQAKTVYPARWSQLATHMFQYQEKILITGLIGFMWLGARYTAHHVRTVLNDCSNGYDMQRSAILLNVHEVAMRERALAGRVLHRRGQHADRDHTSICALAFVSNYVCLV
jgi:hypothetical protein